MAITEQMATITTSLQEVLNRLSSVETTLREEHAKLHEEVCSKVDICEGNVLELQKTVEKLEKEVKIQGNLFEMRERELRRNNIIIIGMDETTSDQRETIKEVRELVQALFRDKLRVEAEPLSAMRIDKRESNRGRRPILVKMPTFEDKLRVIKNRKELRGSRILLKDDLTPSQRKEEEYILRVMKEARQQGKRVVLVGTRLYIDGQLYKEQPVPGP